MPSTYTTAGTGGQTTIKPGGRMQVYAGRDVPLSGRLARQNTRGSTTLNASVTANARVYSGWNVLRSTYTLTGNSAGTQGNLALAVPAAGPPAGASS